MPKIHITTFVAAPVERVFNLGRSINLHTISTAGTNEKAIAGVTTGLINLNETVTWQAKHLFKQRIFVSKISAMNSPDDFTDEMVTGDFKSFKHHHHFKQIQSGTIMIDVLFFESPYGIIGRWFNKLFLTKYLERFLIKRNTIIKEYAESDKWKVILN
jgi:ligand-binding SRPBCC domain-containing protein